MPDFDLLIELAKYYDVEVMEILDGERKFVLGTFLTGLLYVSRYMSRARAYKSAPIEKIAGMKVIRKTLATARRGNDNSPSQAILIKLPQTEGTYAEN